MRWRSTSGWERGLFSVSGLLAASLAGCGGGGDSTTNPVTPAFTLSVSPASVIIMQTGSGSVSVSVVRTGGFAGAVALAFEGLPSGVTMSGSVAASASTGSVAIDVSLNVPASTYPVTIRATGQGVSQQSAVVSLVVTTRPASLTLTRSGNAALTTSAGGLPIAVTLIAGRIEFVGDITFGIQAGSLPSGVTASFSPVTTSGGATVLSLAVAASVAPGNYQVVAQASGAGVTTATLAIPFAVTPQASISVGVSRNPVSIAQGGTAVTSITLVRTNFTGGVSFNASGLPDGVSVTYGSNPTGTNGTGMTFTAQLATVPGTYQVTLAATAPGLADATVVISLIVTQAGTGNTTFQFCGAASQLPIWFAAGLGNTWQNIPPTGGGNSYTFDVGTQGQVAWVTQAGPDDFTVNVYYGTGAELADLASQSCASGGTKTVTGTVAGINASNIVGLTLGGRPPSTPVTSVTPGFSIANVPDGARDLLATRSTLNQVTQALELDRFFVLRGLNPAHNASVGTVDFATSGFAVQSRNATIQNAGASEVKSVLSLFQTPSLSSIVLGTSAPSVATGHTWSHPVAGAAQPGDLYSVTATSTEFAGNVFVSSRSVTHTVTSPADLTFSLGAVPAPVDVFAFSSGPGFARMNASWTVQPDYDGVWTFQFTQASGNTKRTLNMVGSSVILSGSPRLRMPDLNAVPGWQTTWYVQPQIESTWTLTASGWNSAGGLWAPRVDGTVVMTYVRGGTFVW